MLHITNGGCAGDLIRDSGLPGDVLPWRDVLHEGPVRRTSTLEEQSEVRGAFLAEMFGGDAAEIRESFVERDALIRASAGDEEVVLWFEHDLYDQLQIIQILHAYEHFVSAPKQLSIVCIDRFPGVKPFHGLGMLRSGDFKTLYPSRVPVSAEMKAFGARAFDAFCDESPKKLRELATESIAPLPFLRPALERLLQEYPCEQTGLSLTEERTLAALTEGSRSREQLFECVQQAEQARYLGDSTFYFYLERLAASGLLSFGDSGDVELADFGKEVQAGKADLAVLPEYHRWIGGVELRTNPRWRR